ncbi:MAG TPA: DUF4389 domain-containing protein [Propionicimonas sp.]|nr:DUF4389 domain-containing protein [Propionicimonas sp.]
MSASTYPVHVDAELDSRLSRWLWLFKWLLVLPHYFVLVFLWLAFMVMSLVAFFAILFTGRYPRGIFEFNVGVLRWSWRVAYYAYGALGTDRYPPFTLHEVPDYPAHLEVEYPEHLSRGLVLVKWWLLAIPHYIIVGLLIGGVGAAARSESDRPENWGTGLIGILVLVAGIVLLFTGRYPQRLFDFILGLNRWVLRVAGYAGLMTDRYPPFALDQGGHEGGSGSTAVLTPQPPPTAPTEVAAPPATPPMAQSVNQPVNQPLTQPAAPAPPVAGPPAPRRSSWSAGRVLSLVIGSVLVVVAFGLAIPATALVAADRNARDDAGFLMSGTQAFSSTTYAITSENLELHADAPAAFMPEGLLGDAKLTAVSGTGGDVFVGIGPTSEVLAYLGGVRHDTVVDMDGDDPEYRTTEGSAPESPPGDLDFWVAESSGPGTQEITWPLENGDWTVVVMNADGSTGVSVDMTAGAEIPALPWVIGILYALAALALLVALVCIVVPLRGVSREAART